MADEPDNVVELNPGAYKGDDGRFYSRRTGKVINAHVARKRTPEEFAKMRDGLQRAKEEGRMRRKKPGDEIRARSAEDIAAYRDEAIEGLVQQMRDPEVSASLRYNARKLILEYTDGKPTQKVEVEQIEKIEYVLAEHEPPSLQVVPGE